MGKFSWDIYAVIGCPDICLYTVARHRKSTRLWGCFSDLFCRDKCTTVRTACDPGRTCTAAGIEVRWFSANGRQLGLAESFAFFSCLYGLSLSYGKIRQ